MFVWILFNSVQLTLYVLHIIYHTQGPGPWAKRQIQTLGRPESCSPGDLNPVREVGPQVILVKIDCAEHTNINYKCYSERRETHSFHLGTWKRKLRCHLSSLPPSSSSQSVFFWENLVSWESYLSQLLNFWESRLLILSNFSVLLSHRLWQWVPGIPNEYGEVNIQIGLRISKLILLSTTTLVFLTL